MYYHRLYWHILWMRWKSSKQWEKREVFLGGFSLLKPSDFSKLDWHCTFWLTFWIVRVFLKLKILNKRFLILFLTLWYKYFPNVLKPLTPIFNDSLNSVLGIISLWWIPLSLIPTFHLMSTCKDVNDYTDCLKASAHTNNLKLEF